MRRELVIPVAIGILALVIGLGIVLQVNKGAHMELEGKIQKVRIQASDENSAVVVVDFRVTNPADYLFMARKVDVLVNVDGTFVEGAVIADADAKRFMDYYTIMGPKFNDSLKTRDKIPPKATLDRMIAARFELPEAKLQGRKGLKLHIEEVDGQVTEFSQ